MRTSPLLVASLIAAPASAQFGNAWVTFANDPGRIQDGAGNPATLVTTHADEKDFAVGDLDRNGWMDVVMVCKERGSTLGKRRNFLLMNEGGILVDRTMAFASASDVPGDQGFLTPTNDRDVQVVDVNGDGWPDVVTAVTLSDGDPKHVSHPRVYVNLGSSGGVWLGLRHEDARIPQLLTAGGLPVAPRFCSVSAGDVTGDGFPDLYFTDYDSTQTGINEPAAWDLDDRLLVNDGNGFFVDSGTTRMSAAMLASNFAMASAIADMNGDGVLDVVKDTALNTPYYVSVAYNNPANVGYFNLFQNNAGLGSPYNFAVGDLNRDGRPDLIVNDDGADYYRYNLGNDALGRVIWGPNRVYQFLSLGDEGFGGQIRVADLDGDGWNDVIAADFDIEFQGCTRRCIIYHNPGGVVGAEIILREEAQQAGTGGWKGVQGMLVSDMTGTFDVAVLDLDHDGDLDMVFGRCNGTFVWMNQLSSCVFAAYGQATANSAGLAGRVGWENTSSKAANHLRLAATQVPANKTCLFFYGTQALATPAPFGNGWRWIGGTIQRLPVFQTSSSGTASFACDFTAFPMSQLSPGDTRFAQLWFRDPAAGGANFNATDGLQFTVCP